MLLKLPDVSVCDVATVRLISNSALAPTTIQIISWSTTYTVIINMIHMNSLRFNRYEVINIEKVRGINFITKLQEQWKICIVAASLQTAATLCAFVEILEPRTVERSARKHDNQFRREGCSYEGIWTCRFKNELICASGTIKNS